VYESLPEGSSVGVTLGAGAMAGIMEHCLMFPVDCVKTRMQALACDKPKFQSSSIIKNLIYIVKDEGLFRPIQSGWCQGLIDKDATKNKEEKEKRRGKC